MGFQLQIFGPSTPKLIDNKIWPLEIYTITNINNHGNDQKEYTLDEKIDCNQSQKLKEEFVVVKLFHKTKTSIHQITPKDHPTSRLEFDQCYYVNMLQSPTMIEKELKDIVNLNEIIPKSVHKTQSLPNLI